MNPDIGDAVREGKFKTGFSHWTKHGYEERSYPKNYMCLSPEIIKQKDHTIGPFRVNEKYLKQKTLLTQLRGGLF